MPLSNAMLNQYLGLLPAKYWNRAMDPYVYELDVTATALATVTGQLAINSDSDFALYAQTATYYLSTDDVTILATPFFTMQIVDQGSGRFWSSAAVPAESYFGTAQLPYMYQIPKLVGGGSTLNVAVASFAPALAYHVRMSFHGIKLYPFSQDGRPITS